MPRQMLTRRRSRPSRLSRLPRDRQTGAARPRHGVNQCRRFGKARVAFARHARIRARWARRATRLVLAARRILDSLARVRVTGPRRPRHGANQRRGFGIMDGGQDDPVRRRLNQVDGCRMLRDRDGGAPVGRPLVRGRRQRNMDQRAREREPPVLPPVPVP